MTDFARAVGKFVKKGKDRQEMIYKEATQRTIDAAQLPIAKGGRMRIDTSFLQHTGQASLNSIPSGQSKNDGSLPSYDAAVVINSAQAGDTIFFGWSASYAEIRNFKDGFMTVAVENWLNTVKQVVSDAKKRIS